MARSVSEWVGRSDDAAPPARVKDRILRVQGDRCAVESCGRAFDAKARPVFDHVLALINGGENRESNLRAICPACHAPKTRADVAAKAKTARIRKERFGLKAPSRSPLPCGRASPWKRTIGGGTVRRDGS